MSRREVGAAAALAVTVTCVGLALAWLAALLTRSEEDGQRLRARVAALSGALDAAGARAARAEAGREQARARAAAAEAAAAAARAEAAGARAALAEVERRIAREPAPRPATLEEALPVEPPVAPPVAVRELEPPNPEVEALAQVVARGRGRLRVPLGDGALALDLVHVPAGVGAVGVDPAGLPPAERAARALLPAAGFAAPRVSVVLEEGFLIGAGEVTNAQYLAVLEASGVDLAARRRRPGFLAHLEAPAPGWEDAPVRCVSWVDAAEFCRLLGRLVGAPARLPSEVEWELAAAGSAGRRFPWGDAPPELTPAGLGVPRDRTPEGVSGLGLGVHEWCVDPWRPRRWAEATAPLVHRPSEVLVPEPTGADAMTCRGGGPDARSALQVECAWRQGRLAATRGRGVGFRVVIPWAP